MINLPIMSISRRIPRSSFLIPGVVVLAILAALMAGCAGTAPKTESSPKQNEAELVWPGPPEQPRIRYIGDIHALHTEKAKQKTGLKDILLGREEQKEEAKSLVKPYAVYSDSNGRVFITDSVIPGLVVYELKTKRTEFWGTSGYGELGKAMGITGDSAGNIYVSDTKFKRVVVFDHNGKFLKAIGGKDILTKPVGLAFNNETQQLYVVDTTRHHIVVFGKDGQVAFTIGTRGDEPGDFNFPTNIAIDASGRLYVADSMNFRIQILGPDGTFIRTFGKIGNAPGDMNRVKGIGLDAEGHIYAVDASFNNFQVFDQQGRLLLYVGQGGVGPARFSLPAGAYVDKNNRIFIADQFHQRVQMFEYIPDASGGGK